MKNAIHSAEGRKIGPHLQSLRTAVPLNQRELARKLGAAQSEIAKFEQGERRIDLVQFWLFCKAVGASPVEVAAELFRKFEGEADPPRASGRKARR